MRKEKGSHLEIPKATLGLVALNTAIYLFSSSAASFFILSKEFLQSLSLQSGKPFTLLTYMFIHLWPGHLIVDCIMLLFFGWIVERAVGARKTLAIYLVSGVVSGIIYLLFSPSSRLVGSSGAVFGMVGASLVVAPISAFASFILIAYGLSPLVVSQIESFGEEISSGLKEEAGSLNLAYENISREETSSILQMEKEKTSVSEIESSLENLTQKLLLLEQARSTLEPEEYDRALARLLGEQGELEEKKGLAEKAISAEEERSEEISERKKTIAELSDLFEKKISDYSISKSVRETAKGSDEVHMSGLFTGYIFLILIEPNVFKRYNRFLEKLRLMAKWKG